MAAEKNITQDNFILVFKELLKEQSYGSQGQLAQALSERGFNDITQAKISRTLSKLGAVKSRNVNNKVSYILPDELASPRSRQPILSVVLSVRHNKVQIIIKTGIGGAPLIARILDVQGETIGVLGTLAGDDCILIAPTDINRIEEITQNIRNILDLNETI